VRRGLIEAARDNPCVSRQCELIGLSRSSYYYEPAAETPRNLELMRLIDREYMRHPFLGSRRLTTYLCGEGHAINRKRVRRLMAVMGLEAVYPKPRLSKPNPGHRVYPYLLRGVTIERADQVWSTDITYVPMPAGFMYLTAVIDWHSRYVLSWRLSNSLDADFCVAALDQALTRGRPEVFNTDQGSQYTAAAFVARVEASGAKMSMDGRGRWLDNVFVERLWRTVKYEHVYVWRSETVNELHAGLRTYFDYYNDARRHQSLNDRTPAEVYAEKSHPRKERQASKSHEGVKKPVYAGPRNCS
jgi:putative transposase